MNTQGNGINLITIPVGDSAEAKTQYIKLLGVEPYADSPYYVGFKIGEMEIGLIPNGLKQGMTGSLVYVDVNNLKETIEAYKEAGIEILQDITKVGGGVLIARIKDTSGNVFGLRQKA